VKLEVIQPYTRSSENPISFSKGDVVRLGERSKEQWPRWIFCTAQDGREGWVAETMLEIKGEIGTARRDYDAIELSAMLGEELEGFEIVAGWQWCKNAQSEAGWVPLENIRTIQ
jgi:Variant SH3 domain